MAFYDLSKEKRMALVEQMSGIIFSEISAGRLKQLPAYFADEDTYIRKAAYLAIGRIYKANESLQEKILSLLDKLFTSDQEKIRQSCINAAGEIGMLHFDAIAGLMAKGLFDTHHIVRNAVIGSIKKMGEKNPGPTLSFAKQFLHHEDKEIRREICHGIELRGRTHPQDILPMLRELQFDKTARVRNTLVHVLGQIAYKKGCLETVVADLKSWENKALVADALAEIIDVHHRYKNFAIKSQEEATAYIGRHF
jgi:HEAT repeat protein